MKFLHAADLHLDSPLRGLARHEGAPVEALRGATRAAFENLVGLAIEERVDFVLLAGDLYDGTWQDVGTAVFLATKLGELGRAGIRVLAVMGNHDAQSRLTRALERPRNLTLFPSEAPVTELLEEFEVAVHGWSFGRPHVEENLAAGFPAARPGWFNIGLLHTSLDGREGHASYAPCRLSDLRARDYDYWALGHVHAAEEVSTDPWVVYPGCPQGRHVRETGPKGCCLVTVEEGRVRRVERRVLDRVRWSHCEVDLGGVGRPEGVLDAAVQALRGVLDAAGDRRVAARVRFVGAAAVHGRLEGRLSWLRQRLVESAAELDGERLWIEKVEVESAVGDRGGGAESDGALGALVRGILAVPEEPAAVAGFAELLDGLRNKLPPEVLAAEDGLRLDDPEVQARLIREAKALLAARLPAGGGER